MDKYKTTLACTIKNVKFLGFINDEFMLSESSVESTYFHKKLIDVRLMHAKKILLKTDKRLNILP